MTPLQALKAYAKSWGGDLVEVDTFTDPETGLHFGLCPFSKWLAVDWEGKRVLYKKGAKVADMIHELGHVFASTLEPCKSKEMDFFGWEFALAQEVDLVEAWVETNVEYCVGANKEFGQLSIDAQSDLLEEYVGVSKRHGLFDAAGKPRSIR